MSKHLVQLSFVIVLAVLVLEAGCGSFFNQHHGCGTCVAPTFLFTTELNSISGFTVTTSGTPSLTGSVAGPNSTEGIIADRSSLFLFVSDFQNGAVDAFTINLGSGALSPVTGSPFPAGPAPGAGGLAVDATTKFLYVTQMNSSAVAGFAIAPSTGVLTRMPGSPFPAGDTPIQAIIDQTGKFLYVSNLNDALGGISAYTIDPSTGGLSPITGSPFPTQSNFPGPNRMAIGGAGKYLYVGMSGTVNANHSVSAFAIDPNTGALTQTTGSPFPTGNNPQGVASDPTGRFLYTANSQDSTVSAFTIDSSSGALTPISGSPYAESAAPAALAMDPAGQFLYVGEDSTTGIEAFAINATSGAITPIAGSPFSSTSAVNGLTIARP